MNIDYSIIIEKDLVNTVNVSIKLNDENNNDVIKKVVALYCKRKNIKPITLCTQWINTSKISKLLKKEPSFVTFIKIDKYSEQFSLLNELLKGQSYKFENEAEINSFLSQSNSVIKDFLDERLKTLIKGLENYLIWDIEKEKVEEMGIDIRIV